MPENTAKSDKALMIEPVLDREGLKISRYTGQSNRLIICFSGVGKDPEIDQPIEFVDTASNGGQDSVLFIRDTKRSWFNGERIVEDICEAIEFNRKKLQSEVVNTLGHSMGGFGALVFPYFVKINKAVAFSPQFSVDPSIVPDERRWREHTEKISRFRVPYIERFLTDRTDYFVFHGNHHREQKQIELFQKHTQLRHYLLDNSSHNTPHAMKRAGIMRAVVQSAFEGRGRRVRIMLKQIEGRQI